MALVGTRDSDIIVLESLSNSILFDTAGPARRDEKGGWHYVNPTIVRYGLEARLLVELHKLVATWPAKCAFVVVVPFPRYIKSACCNDKAHMSNHAQFVESYCPKAEAMIAKFVGQLERRGRKATMVSYKDITGFPAESKECRDLISSHEKPDHVHYWAGGITLYANAVHEKVKALAVSMESEDVGPLSSFSAPTLSGTLVPGSEAKEVDASLEGDLPPRPRNPSPPHVLDSPISNSRMSEDAEDAGQDARGCEPEVVHVEPSEVSVASVRYASGGADDPIELSSDEEAASDESGYVCLHRYVILSETPIELRMQGQVKRKIKQED